MGQTAEEGTDALAQMREDMPEAKAYDVPHWDCPVCGGVNGLFGQDDAAGEQDCADCGITVRVTD